MFCIICWYVSLTENAEIKWLHKWMAIFIYVIQAIVCFKFSVSYKWPLITGLYLLECFWSPLNFFCTFLQWLLFSPNICIILSFTCWRLFLSRLSNKYLEFTLSMINERELRGNYCESVVFSQFYNIRALPCWVSNTIYYHVFC